MKEFYLKPWISIDELQVLNMIETSFSVFEIWGLSLPNIGDQGHACAYC